MQKINIFIITTFVLVSFAGCKSIGKPVDQSILDHQARVIELENRNRDLTDRIERYDRLVDRTVERLESHGERAAGIGDSAERLEYFFTEYERTVWELIRELRAIAGATGMGETDS